MSKYGNKKTVVNGITFDSAKEAGRFGVNAEMILQENAEQIM